MTSTLSWPSFAGKDPLDTLVLLSRYYGSDPEMVLAGGGNTSVKIGNRLLVKGSGTALATIGRDGFVAMDRGGLEALAHSNLPVEREAREAGYKKALYAARLEPEKNQRPSVEALLHHLVPGQFVVHGHATQANGLTCCVAGEAIAKELLGEDVVWIPFVNPGYLLAQTLIATLDAHRKKHGRDPRAVLMANHGIIVAGDSPEAVRANVDWLQQNLARRIGEAPASPWGKKTASRRPDAKAQVSAIAPTLRGLLAEGSTLGVVTLEDGEDALAFAGSGAARDVTSRGPLSPDQIVYCQLLPPLVRGPGGRSRPRPLLAPPAALP